MYWLFQKIKISGKTSFSTQISGKFCLKFFIQMMFFIDITELPHLALLVSVLLAYLGDFENILAIFAAWTELTVVLLTNNNLAPNSLRVCSSFSVRVTFQVKEFFVSNPQRQDEGHHRRFWNPKTFGGHSKCFQSNGHQAA